MNEDPLDEARDARAALVRAVAVLPDAVLRSPEGRGQPLPALARELYEVAARDRQAVDDLRGLLDALGWSPPAAVRHLEWAPIARARLEAALVGVPEELLDAHPIPGEWSLRQQLAHVRLTDIRYLLATRYGVRRHDHEPVVPPAEIYPEREANPAGDPGQSLYEILTDLLRVRAEVCAALADIPADRLQRPIEWHTAEHTVGFRLHRFAQHDLELTTDIHATLIAAGHRRSGATRVGAALRESFGEIESALLGVPV